MLHLQIVNAVATAPVYIAEKVTGSGKPPKPGEELKPQSASKQASRNFIVCVLYCASSNAHRRGSTRTAHPGLLQACRQAACHGGVLMHCRWSQRGQCHSQWCTRAWSRAPSWCSQVSIRTVRVVMRSCCRLEWADATRRDHAEAALRA